MMSLVIYSSISVLDYCSLLTSVHKIVVITSQILQLGNTFRKVGI